jgi:hypothetical protein
LLSLAVIVAGCAGVGGITPDTPADVKVASVSERAQARWQALVDGDWGRAYGYISPATREVLTLDSYRGAFGGAIKYTKARVEKVECEAEACRVRMQITYDHPWMKGVTTPIDESWILDKGQFWYLYRG